MATASPASECGEHKKLLTGLKENCAILKKLVSTAEDFIDCTSFICSNFEIAQITQEMKSFMNHTAKIQETFNKFNGNLYNLASDSDVFPTAEQDPDEPVETETFKEKRELSHHVIQKTITYIQNPIYMHSALNIAKNRVTREKAGRFLRRQWGYISNMLKKFFPIDSIPSPGEAFNCDEADVFEVIQMPLIHLYDHLISKLNCKRLCNVTVHDCIFTMFKMLNKKFEALFTQTIWQDEEWMNRWGNPANPAVYTETALKYQLGQ